MFLQTLAGPFRKARAVNQTSASFVAKGPTATEPADDAGTATGSAVHDLAGPAGAAAPNSMLAVFYGTGNDDTTGSARLIGWKRVGDAVTGLWVPVVLAEFVVTLSAAVGVAGRDVLATEKFADTLTLTTGNDDVSVDIVSPAGDVVAHVLIDLKGFSKVEWSFSTGSSATDLNALFAVL